MSEGGDQICVVMQPSFLSWSGVFYLIAASNSYIFFDSAQYSKGGPHGWANRNRIVLNGKEHWLTIPAEKDHLETPLLQVRIPDRMRWRPKIAKTLEQAYKKHPFGTEMLGLIVPLIEDVTKDDLASFSIALTQGIAEYLEFKPKFYRASELPDHPGRSERLIEFCRHVGCRTYLSTPGAREYLLEDGVFAKTPDIKLAFMEFNAVPYPQKNTPDFISHLSIVDVLANLGKDGTRNYIVENGRIAAGN